MPTILLVGDAAGSVQTLSAAVPVPYTVRLKVTGRAVLSAVVEGPPPVVVVVDAPGPVDLSIPELLALLAAAPSTARVPVARVSLFPGGQAPPYLEWLTPPTPEASELMATILQVHALRTASALEAKAALRRRVADLSQQASRALIQRQMAQQVARWLDAPPPVADLAIQTLNETEDWEQGLVQVRERLLGDARHQFNADDVERVLARIEGMMGERWR